MFSDFLAVKGNLAPTVYFVQFIQADSDGSIFVRIEKSTASHQIDGKNLLYILSSQVDLLYNSTKTLKHILM